jgi:hypothetical protein
LNRGRGDQASNDNRENCPAHFALPERDKGLAL